MVRQGWRTIIPPDVTGADEDIAGNVLEYLVLCAEEACGNYFCFPRTSTAADDLPVYLFDHELEPNVAMVAQSFDELLWWYVVHAGGGTMPSMANQNPDQIPYATPNPRSGLRQWLSRRAATSGLRMLALVAMTWMGFQLLTPSRWGDLLNLGWWIIYVAVFLFAVEFLLSFFQ